MNERFQYFFALFIILIISISFILPIEVQGSSVESGSEYNVKKGDSMHYKVTIFKELGLFTHSDYEYFSQTTITLEDNSTVAVKEILGTSITINIIDVPSSNQILIQEVIEIPSKPIITSQISNNSQFLITAFTNETEIKQNSAFRDNTQIDGNFIYKTIATKGLPGFDKQVFNWHTGWLEYFEVQRMDQNGTILYDFRIDKMSNDVTILLENLAVVAIITIIPTIALVTLYKWSNSKKREKFEKD